MAHNISSPTPIALFTYNRPLHVIQVLESLLQCKRFDACKLFIYCDGPKSTEPIHNVIASQQVVQSFAEKLGAEVIIQEKHIGLAHSIVSGVTDLCNRFGRVIVIEDDLVVSPFFIDYMLQALDRYQDEERVYQISAFMFPLGICKHQDTFFLPFTTTWGWATWDRAWKKFDWNAIGYQKKFSDSTVRKQFDLDGSYPYYNMLIDRFSGKNDSWGVLWWYAVFSAGGVVLYPCNTFVMNIGFDGSGTHCKKFSGWIEPVKKAEMEIYSVMGAIKFPEVIAVDLQKFDQVKKYLRHTKGNVIQTLLRIFRI
jgi:hypothetical protein